MLTLVIGGFVILLAAFVRTVSGFGFNLIAVPLLTFVVDVKSAIVTVAFLAIGLSLMVAIHMRRHINLRRLIFTGLGSLPGIPIGAYLLSTLDASIIKLAIASLVIPFSVLLLIGFTHPLKRDKLGCGIVGFVAGLIGGTTGLTGPPVVIFWLNQGMVKEKFVATLAAYFVFCNIISLSSFSSFGLVTADQLIKVGIFLLPLWLGGYLGMKVLPRINPVFFRRLAAFVLSATSLVIIVNSLRELL